MRKVYFTIGGYNDAGFTDFLDQLLMVRKLGLSLGYVYFHKRLSSARSTWRAQPLNWPWFLVRLISRIRRAVSNISPAPARSVWDYLGLNHHLAREAKLKRQASSSECQQASIVLGDRALKDNGISTLDGLQAYIKTRVNQEVSEENSSEAPLLLNVCLHYPLDAFRSILNSIPDSIDDLDLPAICSGCRGKRFCRRGYSKAGYPKEGLKTLVHVRQGDVAAVRTPWKTWIYWPKWEKESVRERRGWRECRGESEFASLTVADYHRFVKGLGSRFDDNAFAVQVISDGFERTFDQIYKSNHRDSGLGLARERMNSLLRYRRRYAREFDAFKNMKNGRLSVGEWPSSKFYRFVDAVLTADMLIVGFPSQMTALKVRRYFSSAGRLPAVFLYKPVAERQVRDFLENNPSDKMIAVDISAPDFDRVAARLVELLPSLAPVYRPANTGLAEPATGDVKQGAA